MKVSCTSNLRYTTRYLNDIKKSFKTLSLKAGILVVNLKKKSKGIYLFEDTINSIREAIYLLRENSWHHWVELTFMVVLTTTTLNNNNSLVYQT